VIVIPWREEFTAKRRTVQADLEKRILPYARKAVDLSENTDGWRELLLLVRRLYEDQYHAEGGEGSPPTPIRWIDQLHTTLRKTTRGERSAQNIATWLATVILSEATEAAAIDDEEDLWLEWVTMHDKDVRHAHADADGQQRPIGVRFDVGGHKMRKPGDPSAPIELWINCRCTLRPVLADEATQNLVAAAAVQNGSDEGEPMTDEPTTDATPGAVPWYGVMAPEDTWSGDKRKFAAGVLRTRPLPLPLSWQKITSEGHDGSVTVARWDRAVRVGNEVRATGVMLTTAEADEVIGLIADFGQYGVSIDADDSSFELDEEADGVVFTDARICGASIVSIPAFHQAFIALGDMPEGWFDGGTDLEQDGGSLMQDEALAAALSFDREQVYADIENAFKDLAPGKTEDGPGWLTHPVDTDRLRDYWVRGPGAAKIGWGTAGDFNRCRLAVAEYVKPQYLNGYCANRHYDALGFWPGRPVAGDTDVFAGREGEAAEAISLVASDQQIIQPSAWFSMEEPDELTHFTVTEDGQVYGHVAGWKQCHGSFMDTCVLPPHSYTDYAHYLTGHVLTDAGPVRTGRITVGTEGHAPNRMSMAQAKEHYDKTTSAVADVTLTEGKHGIWACGAVRPGADPEKVYALRASDISGDWRQPGWGQEKEMIAVLAVNRGGFNIPRVAASIRDGQVISLVAAGMITNDTPEVDQTERLTKVLAAQVAEQLEKREARRARMRELAASLEKEETSGV
jgi:hypothetical protein